MCQTSKCLYPYYGECALPLEENVLYTRVFLADKGQIVTNSGLLIELVKTEMDIQSRKVKLQIDAPNFTDFAENPFIESRWTVRRDLEDTKEGLAAGAPFPSILTMCPLF